MNTDQEFLRVIKCCFDIINRYINDTSNGIRYKKMLERLDKTKAGVEKGTLPKDFLYLPVTQMMERDDPDDMIKSIQAVNNYYRTHYQRLVD